MSKAFTREDDNTPEAPVLPSRTPLPPGVKNYLTRFGATRFQEELATLQAERTELLSVADSSEQTALARVEFRIRQLQEILDSAEVVDSSPPERDRVLFGATVAVRDQVGEESTYRIVGVDEVDLDRDWISWQSPLAKALLNKRVGEEVQFKSPAGDRKLKILAVSYEM